MNDVNVFVLNLLLTIGEGSSYSGILVSVSVKHDKVFCVSFAFRTEIMLLVCLSRSTGAGMGYSTYACL